MANTAYQDKLNRLVEIREQERQAVRTAALKSTWVMATMVLWPDTDTEKIASRHFDESAHRPLADWIDDTPTGGQKCIIMHREARKTFLFNIAHCVRLICANPSIRVILVTALQRTAIAMCQNLKRQFTMNPSFRYYFPEMCVDDIKWGKQDEFDHPLAGPRLGQLDCTFWATYSGAPLISRRCDVLKFDDPVDDEAVLNPDAADVVMRHFLQTIPLVERTSTLKQTFFIGTYKSHLDPASAITGKASSSDDIKRELGDWDWIVRPISFVPTGDFKMAGEFAFPDENPEAKPFLKSIFTPEEIRATYNRCLIDPKKGESFFMREYGCMVMAPGDQKILGEWLDTWVEPLQMPQNTVATWMTVDSALKDGQVLYKGDNMVILIGHFDSFGNLYLTDGARSRGWRSEDFRKVLLSMVQNPKNKNPQNFAKEKVGEGGQFFTEVNRWFIDARRPLVMKAIPAVGQGKKMLKIINALQGPLMAKKIFFVKGQFPEEIHKILVEELTHLGQWGHDDVSDALALFFHPDVRPIQQRTFNQETTVHMSRPMQLSTTHNNRGVTAWMAKLQAMRPQLDASGAMVDTTLPLHEQAERMAGLRYSGQVDFDGQRTYVDPTTGIVEKR